MIQTLSCQALNQVSATVRSPKASKWLMTSLIATAYHWSIQRYTDWTCEHSRLSRTNRSSVGSGRSFNRYSLTGQSGGISAATGSRRAVEPLSGCSESQDRRLLGWNARSQMGKWPRRNLECFRNTSDSNRSRSLNLNQSLSSNRCSSVRMQMHRWTQSFRIMNTYCNGSLTLHKLKISGSKTRTSDWSRNSMQKTK